MTLTASQIESVRYHLGWGNIGIAAYPYTPDGFYEVFTQIVSPHLSTATETTATTAITAASNATVTPVSMTDIVVGSQLVVDVDAVAEIVTVRSVTLTTFTAAFTYAHPASGYPVLLMSGKARLLFQLGVAERLWTRMQNPEMTDSFGIKQLGQGEIEWFSGSAVYDGVVSQYLAAAQQISAITRVPLNPETRMRPGRGAGLEVY